ncbi:MAG: hypothetical protein CFE43_20390 [Burkholderiales bacterium PBB3]|nr:MAG: hypothetical protein CFE43_20390 [Burkholderiales bacterium PBB3]
MKLFASVLFCATVVAVSGCSQAPAPAVAQAYANQFGPVESSRFTPCPKVQGVWQLSQLSAGSLLNENGELVQHFRWFGPKLFDLTVGTKAYIAIDEKGLETVLYLSDRIPGPDGQRSLSYTTKSDKELACLGHGWRQAAVSDHSLNDAAARVLGLVPEKPKQITQTDYFAKSNGNELLLAIRIEFEGTNKKQEPTKGSYWHFLKMPRLYENPKEKGFRY